MLKKNTFQRSLCCVSYLCFLQILFYLPSLGMAQSDLLRDINEDGAVIIMGFGDSITYGVGDDTPPGEFVDVANLTDGSRGYLSRISSLGGISTVNRGISGEFLSRNGIKRLPATVSASNADIIIFMEGTNDSSIQLSAGEYRILFQKAINVIRALGRIPIVMTKPLPCCDRASRAPFIQAYDSVVAELAAINTVALIDIKRTWDSTCENKSACELYNVPDGLHPNTLGYDAMGQTILASLFGIDIFAENGAKDLESALDLPEGTVIVKQDPAPLLE